MKYLLAIVSLIATCTALILIYGDQVLKQRHTIGTYTYVMTNQEKAVIDGRSVWVGLQMALQAHHMETNDWTLPTSSTWQPSVGLPPSTNAQIPSRIILMNKVNETRIFVRIGFPASNTVSYLLVRPK